jgi:hypothetical protein
MMSMMQEDDDVTVQDSLEHATNAMLDHDAIIMRVAARVITESWGHHCSNNNLNATTCQ